MYSTYNNVYAQGTYTRHTSKSRVYIYCIQMAERVCKSELHFCVHALPEYAVRCGEIKATTICFFNISDIHLNECDANSYTIVLEEKEVFRNIFFLGESLKILFKYHLKSVEWAERTSTS